MEEPQNQSSVAAQARIFPLKKPGGFHWDFFLLGCTSFIAGIIDIPLPNGLVPQVILRNRILQPLLTFWQAPVHTDALTNYKSELEVIKTEDGSEIRRQKIIAESVVEQRISHFAMGLAIIGTMTGPLLTVLHLIPEALFAGIFFVVGWGGLEGNGIMAKILYLIREPRFVQRDEPLLQIPKARIAFYLFWQILGITITVGMSQTIAAIGFPVLITALIPLRWKVLPMMFTAKELAIMDAPTADNVVVLASLGGKPRMPGDTKDKDLGIGAPESGASGDGNGTGREEDKWSAAERGRPREGVRQRAGDWKES